MQWTLLRLTHPFIQAVRIAANISKRGGAGRLLTKNIDTATPKRRLFLQMNVTFDGFQQELIVVDRWAELVADKEQGRRSGGQRAMDSGKFLLLVSLLRDGEHQRSVGNAIDWLEVDRTALCQFFRRVASDGLGTGRPITPTIEKSGGMFGAYVPTTLGRPDGMIE